MGSQGTDNDYILPNNAPESERLDFQHKLLVRSFGGLHRAPLDGSRIRRVLDIGCGTGNWTKELAEQYPEAEVIGFDINENEGWKSAPKNCHFQVLNLESEETWASLGEFDYIHGRFVTPSVRDWPKVLKRCFSRLRSGGYVEFQEFYFPAGCEDDVSAKECKYLEWSYYFLEACHKCGLDPTVMGRFPELLTDAGFDDVKLEKYKMFIGPWPEGEEQKELGLMGQQNLTRGMYGFGATLFTKMLGWSEEQYQKYTDEVLEEMLSNRFKTSLPMGVGVGRRPA